MPGKTPARLRVSCAEPIEAMMEDELFLRLMVPLKGPDDVRHPIAMVATGHNSHAVVHDLNGITVLLDDFPGAVDLWNRVTVSTANCHH